MRTRHAVRTFAGFALFSVPLFFRSVLRASSCSFVNGTSDTYGGKLWLPFESEFPLSGERRSRATGPAVAEFPRFRVVSRCDVSELRLVSRSSEIARATRSRDYTSVRPRVVILERFDDFTCDKSCFARTTSQLLSCPFWNRYRVVRRFKSINRDFRTRTVG